MEFFKETQGGLLFSRRGEQVLIRPWGKNSLRVQATKNAAFSNEDWGLSLPVEECTPVIRYTEDGAELENGEIRVTVSNFGKLSFYHEDQLLLKEYYRTWEYGTEGWKDLDQITQIKQAAREYRVKGSDHYRITQLFEADPDEKVFGMGQYQHGYLDQKGCRLELMQKNTQASVPFYLSNLGYGFLWNNPAVGEADFVKNQTRFTADCSKQIDYWITAGDTPAQIHDQYMEVTGKPPQMPEHGLGFWQCKLRYQTQEELLEVAREYHRRGIPVDVIVIDFFHWPMQGDWKFDPEYWPDPKAMIDELHSMGMKLMVSVWPTVDRLSENYNYMKDHGLLISTEQGIPVTMECFGFETFFDSTNPEAQKFIWQRCKENYADLGVDLFWLDEAEPEFSAADFGLYRYHMGNGESCANWYPVGYAKAFYDGMKENGVENPMNLIRCAWVGSQRYGALAWSGDVPSTFTQLKNQVKAGLNMGIAGIPWWTADIGGFHGGNIHDPAFQELLMRWFQFGAFCPVMRLHGDRDPHDQAPLGTTGGGMCGTGASNEVWSYPKEVEDMMVYYIGLRNRLRPYIAHAMEQAHQTGTPVIRPLFYAFPEDEDCWEEEESYLFGDDILVSPVLKPGMAWKRVYLPKNGEDEEDLYWYEVQTGRKYPGGRIVAAKAPADRVPVFVKDEKLMELFR